MTIFRSHRGPTLLGALAALVAMTASACADGETERDRVAAAVEGLQEDLAAGRVTAVCAALAERPRHQIGSVGHGRRPTTCERDLRDYVLDLRQTTRSYGSEVDLRRAERPTVVEVALGPGDARAAVTMTYGDDPFDVPMVERDGSWKLDDFYGVVGPPPRALR